MWSNWDFYIGGYQPAQKWLKDRKERTLEFEDILHYQKIIVALYKTAQIMQAIDEIAQALDIKKHTNLNISQKWLIFATK